MRFTRRYIITDLWLSPFAGTFMECIASVQENNKNDMPLSYSVEKFLL